MVCLLEIMSLGIISCYHWVLQFFTLGLCPSQTGRLGQLGLKENQATLVQSLAKAVKQFGNHKLSNNAAMPWEVQLSVVYATHDLAPSNPKEALVALASWQKGITCPIPPAIKRCTTQIGTLCQKTKEI